MKARFYVTVEVPTPESRIEKIKAKEAKAEVISEIEFKVAEAFAEWNPEQVKVRFPRQK
jgi:hypothetical protein